MLVCSSILCDIAGPPWAIRVKCSSDPGHPPPCSGQTTTPIGTSSGRANEALSTLVCGGYCNEKTVLVLQYSACRTGWVGSIQHISLRDRDLGEILGGSSDATCLGTFLDWAEPREKHVVEEVEQFLVLYDQQVIIGWCTWVSQKPR